MQSRRTADHGRQQPRYYADAGRAQLRGRRRATASCAASTAASSSCRSPRSARTPGWPADQAGSNNKEFDTYSGGLNSTVAPLANTWNPAYQAINTLNAALDRGPSTAGISPTVKTTLLAEAHFLRALNYFTLVQTFGDVTLSLHENQGVVATAVRDPAADVYQCDPRRPRHARWLDLRWRRADFGRATKGAALTLRSKVYLDRAYQAVLARASRPTSRLRSPMRKR